MPFTFIRIFLSLPFIRIFLCCSPLSAVPLYQNFFWRYLSANAVTPISLARHNDAKNGRHPDCTNTIDVENEDARNHGNPLHPHDDNEADEDGNVYGDDKVKNVVNYVNRCAGQSDQCP